MGCSKKVAYNSRQVKLMTGLLLLLPGLIVLFPVQAWALQTHGAPEGIIVHQMAHVFYFGALVYLFWDLRRTMSQGRGWKFLQIFCLLMMLWNILAFVGHQTHLIMDAADFSHEFGYLSSMMLGPFSATKLINYFARLDHLILVPALIFLFLSLRSIYRSTAEGEDS
ncbi:MAG: hypothetical protein H8E79_08625 [Desulfobulbaceae bacterium]|uniref:Uncharacterized protein n=1 Tax=Candidatus Desulfatifera sulfidica TaxID=2841691 RepID=A0A8J6TAR3_9BACT|nr:hypothetical protein [Candidatus Desulfatifera sulfidica]